MENLPDCVSPTLLGKKEDQYQRWLKRGTCIEDDVLVIALDTTELDLQYTEDDAHWVLYGFGRQFAAFSTETGEFVREGTEYAPNVKKPSAGQIFEANFFRRTKVPIDAVIIGDRHSPDGRAASLAAFLAIGQPSTLADLLKHHFPISHAYWIEETEESFHLREKFY